MNINFRARKEKVENKNYYQSLRELCPNEKKVYNKTNLKEKIKLKINVIPREEKINFHLIFK